MCERAHLRGRLFRRLPNYREWVVTQKWWAASQQVEENRAEAVNIGGRGQIGGFALSLLGRSITRRSESSQRFRKILVCVEPFCQTEIAHQWVATVIEQNVSRLE